MNDNSGDVNMILAGDIGGTTTRLGLFDPIPIRPRLVVAKEFFTLSYADLPSMLQAFLDDARKDVLIDAAAFGVAGPVVGDSADLTNVPWRVDARRVGEHLAVSRVVLMNDLLAMAYSVPVLDQTELVPLQAGEALRGGNMALIAAGTGLGEALLHNIDGRFLPSPSEGGHADFAPRTERDIEVLRDITLRHGRASVESVVSGRGLVNIFHVTHAGASCRAAVDEQDPEAPAAISTAALESQCERCVEALDVFVGAYGAEAGNLALRSVSTGGVFVGGGIAPKILPALTDGRFMRAFVDKAPLDHVVRRMPVHVILNSQAGLLGAAVRAAQLTGEP